MGGHRPHRLAGGRDWLLARIAEKPDLTLRAIRAELVADGVKASYGAVWAFFAREGITFKKRACTPASRTAPTSPAGATGGRNIRAGLIPSAGLYRRDLGQDQHDPAAWALPPRHPPGRKVPQARWRTLTFLAALRCDRIAAPCVIDGPINGTSFRAYVEQFLVPTLSPGDIVIMDNLGSHKGLAVRRLIRAAGAKLFFLPRYSPDLNPIEQVFAKLKTLLRKADPRTTEAPGDRSAHSSTRFTAEECANYLANAGYAST